MGRHAAQLRLVQHLAVVGSDEQRSAAEIHERLEIRDVPGTLQIGYEIEGNEAYPAARKLIEIGQRDSRYKTRRWVVAPLAR